MILCEGKCRLPSDSGKSNNDVVQFSWRRRGGFVFPLDFVSCANGSSAIY